MSDREYDSLSLVGYREPDYSLEKAPNGTLEQVELPGIYRVGFLVGDHFVEVSAFKAGLLTNSAAQAAKRRQAESGEQSQQTTSG